jgi:hypothetical protein
MGVSADAGPFDGPFVPLAILIANDACAAAVAPARPRILLMVEGGMNTRAVVAEYAAKDIHGVRGLHPRLRER